MKKSDVMITLLSIHNDGVSKDETELITEGAFEKTDEGFIISYDETEATGFEGSTTVLTTFGNRLVNMERQGTAPSNLVIEKGKKHHCHYGTPLGDFMVGITTNEINSNLTKTGGELYFRYNIDINSSFVSEQEIFIKVKANSHN